MHLRSGRAEEYYRLALSVRPNDKMSRDALIARLIDINYKRNDLAPERTNFRVRGDTVDIFPANMSEHGIRVEFFGNEIDGVSEFDIVSGNIVARLAHAAIFPASHYAVEHQTMMNAIEQIERDWRTAGQIFYRQSQVDRGATHRRARSLRHRNDEGNRLLLGHRKLLAVL